MRNVLFTLLLTTLFAFSTGATNSTPQMEVPKNVLTKIKSGDYNGAIRYIKALIKEHPNNAKLEELLGEILLIDNRPNESIFHLKKSEKILADSVDSGQIKPRDNLHLSLGIAYFIAGNYVESEKNFAKVVNATHAVAPDTMKQALNYMANLKEYAHDYKTAQSLYKISATKYESRLATQRLREIESKIRYQGVLNYPAEPASEQNREQPNEQNDNAAKSKQQCAGETAPAPR